MKKHIPLMALVISLAYFIILSAKTHTWVFISGDSGGYLAASRSWQLVPQFGAPLYVLLGHLINWILPSIDLNLKLTILLSCLPAALTIYLVTKKANWMAGLICAASAVFLTSSTVLRNYAPSLLFIVWAYYQNSWKRYLLLGISACFHPMSIALAGLWFISDLIGEHKWSWINLGAFTAGCIPFVLIPIQMSTDIPRYIAGPFNITNINTYGNLVNYFFNGASAVSFKISTSDVPLRLLEFLKVFIPSTGLAILPFLLAKKNRYLWIAVTFPIFYYLMDIDRLAWTYNRFAIPFIAIAAASWLITANKRFTYPVIASCLILLAANSWWMNADRLTNQLPMGSQVHEELMQVPNGSAVMSLLGFSTLEELNVLSENKDIILLVPVSPTGRSPSFYLDYLKQKFGIEVPPNSTSPYNNAIGDELELAKSAFNKGIGVYLIWDKVTPLPYWWSPAPILQGNGYVVKVIGFTSP